MATLPKSEEGDFNFIYNEVHRIRTQWAFFEQLFIGDIPPPGRGHLHSNADRFMEVLRPALANDILLTICRLCDRKKAKVAGLIRENLVFARLVKAVPPSQPKMSKLLALYKTDLKPVRHRRGAHNDRNTIMGMDRLRSPVIGRMRKAVTLCGEIVSDFHTHYGISEQDICLSRVADEINSLEAALRFLNAPEKHPNFEHILGEVKAERSKFERPKTKSKG